MISTFYYANAQLWRAMDQANPVTQLMATRSHKLWSIITINDFEFKLSGCLFILYNNNIAKTRYDILTWSLLEKTNPVIVRLWHVSLHLVLIFYPSVHIEVVNRDQLGFPVTKVLTVHLCCVPVSEYIGFKVEAKITMAEPMLRAAVWINWLWGFDWQYKVLDLP